MNDLEKLKEGKGGEFFSFSKKNTMREASVDEVWLKLCRRADEGDPEAQYEVAVKLSEKNQGQCEDEIGYYLGRSALKRYAPACLAVAMRSMDPGLRQLFLEPAAEKGVPEACLLLWADLQKAGKQADYWLEKVPVKEHGEVMLRLAKRFQEAPVKKNEVQAFAWLQRAIEAGVPNAIDRFFEEEKETGCQLTQITDIVRNIDVQAMTHDCLGKLYSKGKIVTQDQKHGVEYFLKAAENGYADAQFHLGNCYAQGLGTEEDWREAVKWFSAAAAQGHAAAKNNLAYALDEGLGIERDQEQARKLYEEAAKAGSAAARNNLGHTYSAWGPTTDED